MSKQTTQSTQWPGAFGIYKQSQDAIMTNIGVLILLGLLNFAVQILITAVIKNQTVAQLLSNVVSIILGPAYIIVILQSIAKKKIDLTASVQQGLDFVLHYFILNILIGFALILSVLAFIIPFFFVMPRLILAPYFLIDQKLDALAAFKASWNQTKGHSAKVWGIIGASFVMVLPVFTIIGIPIAIYLLIMYSAASGILYGFIKAKA